MIDFLKDLLRKSPARVIAYGGAAAVTGSLWLAKQLGVTLTPEVQGAILGLATFILTELIRRVAYSPNTVAEITGAPVEALPPPP